MTRTTSRRITVATTAVALAALAGPALAAAPTPTINVGLSGTVPTRTFAVKNMAGSDLTDINLGKGGTMPFQTLVNDSDVTGTYGGFDVQATMSNLYLKTGSGHDFSKKIASSDASLLFPLGPLSASGVTYTVVPKINVTVAGTCSDSNVQTVLGITGIVFSLLPVSTQNLCNALSGATAATAVVDGVSTVTNLTAAQLDALSGLPLTLTSAADGSSAPFTNADYGPSTVGAGDPAAGGAPGATKVPVMSGGQPSAGFLASLAGIVSGLPTTLASADGTGARTTVQNVLDAFGAPTAPAALQTLSAQLSAMTDASQRTNLINLFSSTVQPLGLDSLVGIGGQYRSTPVLRAVPSTMPASGQYDGTLTITFIQH